MKKIINLLCCFCTVILFGCSDNKSDDTLTFAVSGEYPPFEYYKDNELQGFDIDLARLIGRELKREVQFKDMDFSAMFPAIQNDSVHAAISTITITAERQKNFDFSNAYYQENLFIVYDEANPILQKDDMKGKKVAALLGSTMETWLKKNVTDAEIIIMNNNNQEVEALKVGNVNGVLMDGMQAFEFTKQNPNLKYAFIDKSENGYGIVFKKGSNLVQEVNKALAALEKSGELTALKQKWLETK